MREQNYLDEINYAIDYGNEKTLRDVLSQEKSIKYIPQNWNNSPVLKLFRRRAFEHCRAELLEILIDKGVNLNIESEEKRNNLWRSVAFYKDLAMSVIRENKFNLNHKYFNGDTALHIIAIGNDPSLIEEAVIAGAEINAQNKFGQTPLHLAARSGDMNNMLTLTSLGANINIKDSAGKTIKDSEYCMMMNNIPRIIRSVSQYNRCKNTEKSVAKELFIITAKVKSLKDAKSSNVNNLPRDVYNIIIELITQKIDYITLLSLEAKRDLVEASLSPVKMKPYHDQGKSYIKVILEKGPQKRHFLKCLEELSPIKTVPGTL